MTQLTFTPLEKEYRRIYCQVCQKTYLTKMSEYEILLCPECDSNGIRTEMLFTVKGVSK